MWSQWLVNTLRPRRTGGEAAPTTAASGALLPELEGDGMHPGADEFRSALSHGESDRADRVSSR